MQAASLPSVSGNNENHQGVAANSENVTEATNSVANTRALFEALSNGTGLVPSLTAKSRSGGTSAPSNRAHMPEKSGHRYVPPHQKPSREGATAADANTYQVRGLVPSRGERSTSYYNWTKFVKKENLTPAVKEIIEEIVVKALGIADQKADVESQAYVQSLLDGIETSEKRDAVIEELQAIIEAAKEEGRAVDDLKTEQEQKLVVKELMQGLLSTLEAENTTKEVQTVLDNVIAQLEDENSKVDLENVLMGELIDDVEIEKAEVNPEIPVVHIDISQQIRAITELKRNNQKLKEAFGDKDLKFLDAQLQIMEQVIRRKTNSASDEKANFLQEIREKGHTDPKQYIKKTKKKLKNAVVTGEKYKSYLTALMILERMQNSQESVKKFTDEQFRTLEERPRSANEGAGANLRFIPAGVIAGSANAFGTGYFPNVAASGPNVTGRGPLRPQSARN